MLAALRGPRRFLLAAVASLLVAVAASLGLNFAETPLPEAGLELVADGLPGALLVTAPPADDRRLFVVQKTGQIRIIEDGRVLHRPFLDIGDRVSDGTEQGLLGLAFHPDFARNGRFFVDYTDRAGATRVVEYRVSADPDVADPSSARTLLAISRPGPIHNGGHLAFGPDGMLYIASGDGGGGDPHNNGQRLDTLLAKLLRIDVDRADAGMAYGIPPDNPFVGNPSARPEIWAYGLRNPWRFSFDRETGNIWVGDVGEIAREEVDLIPAGVGGLNFGWNQYEGFHPYTTPSGEYSPPHAFPVTDYGGHRARCSITGGFVYRGAAVPDLRGRYVFGDWCSGEVFWVPASAAPARTMPVAGLEDVPVALSSFGEDPSGELYLAAAGKVFKIVAPRG